MDFFDHQKQKKHAIRLAVGYAVIATALVLATIVLLYQASGYWLDKEGRIIRNGLVFVSSKPKGADIYLNGERHKSRTNARLTLPSGQYLLELKRDGYTGWKRILTVEGGSLERFDYSLLFPLSPPVSVAERYKAAPSLSTASPDRRWLLVAVPGTNNFDRFDLNAESAVGQTLTVPTDILAAGSTTRSWQLVEWADDNRHVVLRRVFDSPGQRDAEYILFDRENPSESQNLSVAFGFTPDKLELRDQAFDRYYLYDQTGEQLFTATLNSPTPQPYIAEVLNFTSEGNAVAYATTKDAPTGKVLVRLQQGDEQPFTVKQLPVKSKYLLDMAIYEDRLYVAAGAVADDRVFLYKDPFGSFRRAPTEPLVPVQILKVDNPNRVSFSTNERFVAAENGDRFAVYDAETDRGYAYRTRLPLDKPQSRAHWVDGFHLSYVSRGKTIVFDADGTNVQTLLPAAPGYIPVFDSDYRFMYFVSPRHTLTAMSLLITEDR